MRVVTINAGPSCSPSVATAAATKGKGEAKETGTICVWDCKCKAFGDLCISTLMYIDDQTRNDR